MVLYLLIMTLHSIPLLKLNLSSDLEVFRRNVATIPLIIINVGCKEYKEFFDLFEERVPPKIYRFRNEPDFLSDYPK
jgi:hypothetical protein